jgi:RNA polymerase sigma-70 factor, ECF subfamily
VRHFAAIVTERGQSPQRSASEEAELVEALRRGDNETLATLVDDWSSSMLRLALVYVRDRSAAEEVVQDTWIGMLEGIGRFEGRSSLKTWVFQILTNKAKTLGAREQRSVPFSALDQSGDSGIDPERFLPAGDAWAGHWAAPPRPLAPDERLLARESRELLARAIRELPPAQRAVLSLRDVAGWSAEEVCNVLELSETNQRVLLHRARSNVQRVLEPHLTEEQ